MLSHEVVNIHLLTLDSQTKLLRYLKYVSATTNLICPYCFEAEALDIYFVKSVPCKFV